MKVSLLTALLVSFVGVGVASADSTTTTETKTTTEARTAPQPEVRRIELSGLNGRTTIVISEPRSESSQAPYALHGSSGGEPAKAPQQGYQAR